MNKINTVKIASEDGYIIINECDKADDDKLFVEGGTQSEGPTVKELKTSLDELGVEYKGNASKAVLAELLAESTAE